MSDKEQQDTMDAFEQQDEEGTDVEAHSLDAKESLDQLDATEEPPDVEGHAFEQIDQLD